MKVSIGSRVVEGPWGGGNLFVLNLSNFLEQEGHEVIYDLSEPDIDLIVLTDPRSRKESTSTYNHVEIEKYKKYVNNSTAVVQRINECDERKGTSNINNFYLEASDVADHIVFVSSWLEDIYLGLGMNNKKTSVILSGSDSKIFNSKEASIFQPGEKIRLLTHHWSSNRNKGFDTYEEINRLMGTKKWETKLEFTYIGNTSDEYKLDRTNLINPLAGNDLADEIRKHHVYVTASINEPSGNHHIEAAQCGLPVLYIESGGIPEYCNNYGLGFTDDFEIKLEEIINNYPSFKKDMSSYPFNSQLMCQEYLDLFLKLVNSKNNDLIKKPSFFTRAIFIAKQKGVKVVRDIIYFKIKFSVVNFLKKIVGKRG